jgi:predicted MFS family arabinose efflux permease
MSFAPELGWLLALRIVSGVTNVGIVVMGLTLVGDVFPAAERGRALGWVFGAVAGGCSFGSTLGGVLSPLIGWRGLFLLVAVPGFAVIAWAWPLWQELGNIAGPNNRTSLSQAIRGYFSLVKSPRGSKTYAYIVLNGVFHSGVFTWLGVLFHDRFGLGDMGIGLALLGYGVPGMFLGPFIGRFVDRHGRRRLIPAGLVVAAAAAALLAPAWPLGVAVAAVTILSVGFDMTHPLFAGIATALGGDRRGQAMGLNTFSLFLGFGLGSLVFGRLAQFGMSGALATFAVAQGALGVLAIPLFRKE